MANARAGAEPLGMFGTFVTVLIVTVLPPNSSAGMKITVLFGAPVVEAKVVKTPNFIKRNFKIEDMVKISIITLSKKRGSRSRFSLSTKRYYPTGG